MRSIVARPSKTFFADLVIGRRRVTRLGEFSPIGRWFCSGSLLKITEVDQSFALLFSREKAVN
jgi:microcystin-dependent protein